MKNNSIVLLLSFTLLTVSFLSCRKDGMHSKAAQKIQYRWERISSSNKIDYFTSYVTTWTVNPASPGFYTEFGNDGFFYQTYGSNSLRYQYKVDGDKILYVHNEGTRFTTPHYTDTNFIKEVNDHLLILYTRKYFLSPGYSYLNEYLDSLKK